MGPADRYRRGDALVVRAEQAVDVRGRPHSPSGRGASPSRGGEGAGDPRDRGGGRRLRCRSSGPAQVNRSRSQDGPTVPPALAPRAASTRSAVTTVTWLPASAALWACRTISASPSWGA